MKTAILATVMTLSLAATGVAQSQQPGTKAKGKDAQTTLTVNLGAQNKSGESGTARLTPMNGETRVELTLKGAPKGVAQPAHIHAGTCAKLDPKPKYPLDNVVDGKSTTVVPASLDSLLDGKTAINVHKSGDEIKVYVACGNITRSGGARTGGDKK